MPQIGGPRDRVPYLLDIYAEPFILVFQDRETTMNDFKAYVPGQTIGYIGRFTNVVKVRGGFAVQATIPPAMSDDPYETVLHCVTFLRIEDARALCERMKVGDLTKTGQDRWRLCLDHWTWSPSVCSSYGFMHQIQTFGMPLKAAA